MSHLRFVEHVRCVFYEPLDARVVHLDWQAPRLTARSDDQSDPVAECHGERVQRPIQLLHLYRARRGIRTSPYLVPCLPGPLQWGPLDDSCRSNNRTQALELPVLLSVLLLCVLLQLRDPERMSYTTTCKAYA